MAVTVRAMRGSSIGKNPRTGIRSRLASNSELSKLCVKACRAVLYPLAHTVRWISSRTAHHRSIGTSKPYCSASLMLRSNATHAITFECVKCLFPPRTSQMPSSGSFHIASRCSSAMHCNERPARDGARPLLRARCSASIISPQTSSWNWSDAALPIRTGNDPR